MRLRASLLIAALVLASSGCRVFIGAHYLFDPASGKYHAACRVWSGTILMKGETTAACIVPRQDDREIPTGLTTSEDVAVAISRGWESTSKGTDDVDGGSTDLGHTGDHATTSAGGVEFPLVGSSGIVLAQRDDDIGVETASIIRWFIGVWGIVTLGLEAIDDAF